MFYVVLIGERVHLFEYKKKKIKVLEYIFYTLYCVM